MPASKPYKKVEKRHDVINGCSLIPNLRYLFKASVNFFSEFSLLEF